MPYIKRTTRIGETVEAEYYYTAKKHKADGNKEKKKIRKIKRKLPQMRQPKLN